ncbi:MAG: hypothetical protein M1833_000109 [Piccolia ochrophora]|nr:MAG: hypothetical protein M1833_000109 [Piccolia ochrophora]
MPPLSSGPSSSPAWLATVILSTTPTEQLPPVVPYLCKVLHSQKNAYVPPGSHASDDNGPKSMAFAHEYKTRLSTLLQGRSVEGRWAAVVLIKTTIELGGWEILRACEPWVRGLVIILGQHDPPTTKSLCILTLTRIFLLLSSYPTLVGEITQPHLPTFLRACLQLIGSKAKDPSLRTTAHNTLSRSVFESCSHLLPVYTTRFRPHAKEIHSLLLKAIVPNDAQTHYSQSGQASLFSTPGDEQVNSAARKTFVLLHFCAPKDVRGALSDEWQFIRWLPALQAVIAGAHSVSDQVFLPVKEAWTPGPGLTHQVLHAKSDKSLSGDFHAYVAEMIPNTDIRVRADQLAGILAVLKQFIVTPTGSSVQVPVGQLMHLLTRIFSVTVPSDVDSGKSAGSAIVNPESDRYMLETLWAGLPQLHAASMELLLALMKRFGHSLVAITQESLELVCWIFSAETWDTNIRRTCYAAVAEVLRVQGRLLSKPSIKSLVLIVQCCCRDLISRSDIQTFDTTGSKGSKEISPKTSRAQKPALNADAMVKPSTAPRDFHASKSSDTYDAAWELLPLFITHLPPQSLPLAVRDNIERTAILAQHTDAMIACTLQPRPLKSGGRLPSSIMPHLARISGDDSRVEGLIKPRMLMIPTSEASNSEDGTNAYSELRGTESRGFDMDFEEKFISDAVSPYKDSFLRSSSPPAVEIPGSNTEAKNAVPSSLERETSLTKDPRCSTSEDQSAMAVPSPSSPPHQLLRQLPDHIPSFDPDSPPTKRPRFDQLSLPPASPSAMAPQAIETPAGNIAVALINNDPVPSSDHRMGGVGQGGAARGEVEDSDDDFEIPELVLSSDTDEDGAEEDDEDGADEVH